MISALKKIKQSKKIENAESAILDGLTGGGRDGLVAKACKSQRSTIWCTVLANAKALRFHVHGTWRTTTTALWLEPNEGETQRQKDYRQTNIKRDMYTQTHKPTGTPPHGKAAKSPFP